MSDSQREFTAQTNSSFGIWFLVGLAILVCGYASALIGSILMFRISYDLTLSMVLGGMLLAVVLPKYFDKRLGQPVWGRWPRLAVVAGIVFSVAVLMFAERITNIYAWYVHPAGLQITWPFMVGAVVHGHHICQQFAGPKDKAIAVGRIYEPAETLETNPYAPPRS